MNVFRKRKPYHRKMEGYVTVGNVRKNYKCEQCLQFEDGECLLKGRFVISSSKACEYFETKE